MPAICNATYTAASADGALPIDTARLKFS